MNGWSGWHVWRKRRHTPSIHPMHFIHVVAWMQWMDWPKSMEWIVCVCGMRGWVWCSGCVQHIPSTSHLPFAPSVWCSEWRWWGWMEYTECMLKIGVDGLDGVDSMCGARSNPLHPFYTCHPLHPFHAFYSIYDAVDVDWMDALDGVDGMCREIETHPIHSTCNFLIQINRFRWKKTKTHMLGSSWSWYFSIYTFAYLSRACEISYGKFEFYMKNG